MLRPTLVAVLLLAAAAHSRADDPDLRAWFDRRLQIAAEGAPTSGFRFQWRLEHLEVPTEAQLNALRQAVQGRPEHPERQTLATYEWRQKNTQYTDKVLWSLDGVFRFNESFHWLSKSQFADIATHPSATWLLTEGQITLVDADGPVEPGYDYRASVTRVHMRELRYFFTGGLYAPAGADRSGALRLSGDRWSCRFESTDASGVRRVVEASGAWHADAGHGTVDRADMRAVTGDKVERQLIHAKDWRIEPALGEVVAHEVLVSSPDGRPLRRYLLAGVEPVTAADMARLTAIPALGGSDPIRGELAARGLSDMRRDGGVYHRRMPDGQVQTMPTVDQSIKQYDRWLSALGIGLLVLVLALVVLWRVRCRRASDR